MTMVKTLFNLLMALFLSHSASAGLEVMCYNVRFENEADGENSWSQRKEYIATQLQFHEPDILGVQEAVVSQLKHFQDHLPGYGYVGVGRDDGKEKGEFSAIFYRTDRFALHESDTFWLSETPHEVSIGWDASMERVCTYARFEDRETGQQFWVFNAHFDHRGERAKEESAKLVYRKIDDITEGGLPVILMGDFNMEPQLPGIRFLADNMNESRAVADLVFGPEGTFNGFQFHHPVTRRIDYIFTSKQTIDVLKYAVLSDSKDLKYPSDHLPVWVEIEFTP